MGLITYENLEDGQKVTANIFNERFSQIVSQLNGNISSDNILNDSISKEKIKLEVFESAYPVGSAYINFTNSANPATILGFGTWVAVPGRFIAGYDEAQTEFNAAEKTGGRKKLKNMYMPNSNAVLTINDSNGDAVLVTDNSFGGAWFDNSTAGDGSTGTIIPPYIVAYVWKRTA